MTEQEAIVFENVKFSYPGSDGVFAVNGVSLTVKKGEFLSVIGHNGSGKSTLARLTNGLLEADAGKITVLGLDVAEGKNSLEIRKHVGIVFQNPDNQMVASIVEDDVAFGPENIGIEREEIGRRIEWALKAVGMEEYRRSTPTRLSGGQKQRIAVAGVLAVKPEILILDESTEIVLQGTPEEIFESGDRLEMYNLCLPRITEIINTLNGAGMKLDNVLRPEELAEGIIKNLSARGISNAKSSPASPAEINSSHEWDIDVKNLTFTYSKKSPFATKALKGINLHIDDGEFFGIIGHTGSGKSTLVQHLNALIKLPQAEKKYRRKKVKKGRPAPVLPEITVGQFNLADKKTDFKALRANVGMVFQYPEYQLFAESVFADVAFGLKNFNKKLSAEEVEKAVRESIEIVGLDYNEVKDKSPFDLSGGQKRRVAIAGVIVTKPRILILDEPAAGLDPLGKKEIMELLHKLHREWCNTVIIVSHDMDEVAENCTKAAVIAGGEVVFAESPSKLFARGNEILSLGLDVPLTSKICAALEKSGVEVECDCTAEDFSRKIIEIYGGGENA